MCNDDEDIALAHFALPLHRDDVVAYAPKIAEHYGWQAWTAIAIGTVLVGTKEDEQCLMS